MAPLAPLIAIVGRPNVGKSTLYNRIIGGRPALVHDTPGLTRDRRYGEFEYFGRMLRLVDTGGLDPDAEKEVIGAGIHRQARLAIDESDAVVFVVDATAGVTPGDAELCQMLRKSGKPIFLAANKIDGPKRDPLANDLYSLGLGEVYPVSAAHGRGVDDLLQTMVDQLGIEPTPPEPEEDAEGGPLRIAFVGKPNAGKSSIVNRLLGTERALVHHVPGTTTDPVDTPFEFGGRSYVLIDTAGIRRRARIDADTEKISVSLAINQVRRAHVVVLVVDGKRGPSEQDARLAGAIEERGRAMVIALNKSDLLTGASQGSALKQKAADEMHFLKWVPQVMTSALRGDGMSELLDKVDEVSVEHRRRIQTSELNTFFEQVCESHPPPLHKGRSVRIKYLTQARAKPPTFVLMVNRPDGISPSYRRYLVNQLRARYGFVGTPLRMLVKASSKRKYGKKKSRR